MTTLLPHDNNDSPIPVLRLKNNGAHTITSAETSARNTTAFDTETRVLSVFATQDIYIRFGDSTVTATTSDHFYPAGIYYDFAIGGESAGHYTHLAVLQQSAGGTVYISEKE